MTKRLTRAQLTAALDRVIAHEVETSHCPPPVCPSPRAKPGGHPHDCYACWWNYLTEDVPR
jgi:hypothetical protein